MCHLVYYENHEQLINLENVSIFFSNSLKEINVSRSNLSALLYIRVITLKELSNLRCRALVLLFSDTRGGNCEGIQFRPSPQGARCVIVRMTAPRRGASGHASAR